MFMRLRDLDPAWQYPADVPEEIETQINEVLDGDKKLHHLHSDPEKQVQFASMVYWALQSDERSLESRRLEAQEIALDVFDWSGINDPKIRICNICGNQAFENTEYQPVKGYAQGKWQKLFERVVQAIEQRMYLENITEP